MIIDTDVLIWELRGSKKAQKELAIVRERSISAVTAMELIAGARNKEELKEINSFISTQFTTLPITDKISNRAIYLMESHSLQNGLKPGDALIAATAIEHSAELFTANDKHYRFISGIEMKRFRNK